MPITVMIFLISVLLTVGFIFYQFYNTRNKERMAIIEKGGDIKYPESSSKFSALKWGLVLLCLGLALSLGIYVDISRNHDGPFFTLPFVVIGAGLGMLLYYAIVNRMKE